MASKLSREPRRIGELIVIVAIAAFVLALGAVATRGFPGKDGNGTSSVGGDPHPSATPVASPTAAPEATRDPRDTWVPPEQFPGVPAIQPSRDTVVPGEPRVTESDVEAYVASDAPDVVGTDEIVSIEFLPASEYESRVGAPGRYGGRLLCAVQLRGSFPVKVPRDVAEDLREAGTKLVAPQVTLIFDALTGNLLTTSYPP